MAHSEQMMQCEPIYIPSNSENQLVKHSVPMYHMCKKFKALKLSGNYVQELKVCLIEGDIGSVQSYNWSYILKEICLQSIP